MARSGYNRGVDYLRRIPAVFAADHRIDANGKLDSSLAPVPEQRYGLTSRSPSSGSPFADHWIAFPYRLSGPRAIPATPGKQCSSSRLTAASRPMTAA